MEEVLNAIERKEKGKISRKHGFIPGVVYGKDEENGLVKFQENELISLLKKKGEKSKISFSLNNEKKQGIIKEVGRDVSTGKIIHIDIQIVDAKEEVKWSIPIAFEQKDSLQKRDLYLQVYATEVEVEGESAKIPNNISIDVKNMECGEEIKVKDLNITSEIKVLDDPEDVLALITTPDNKSVDDTETVDTTSDVSDNTEEKAE